MGYPNPCCSLPTEQEDQENEGPQEINPMELLMQEGTNGTAKRNCLTPEAFEALQLLKSAYRNGHLAADKDTHKHSLSDMDTYS